MDKVKCCACGRRKTDGKHRKCNRCRVRFLDIDNRAADPQEIRAAMLRTGVPVRKDV